MIPARAFSAAVLLALLAAASALAQPYPAKPIRMIAPYPPGGVVDVIARAVGERLSLNVGQPVLVENRPGASGNIGTELAARAPTDGYTVLLASAPHTINPSLFRNLSWHPVKSFAPIVMVGAIPNVIVVHPSVPARSLAELVAHAKARPGQLNYGSVGAGSTLHLAMETLKQAAGIFVVHIPYRGQPEAVAALLAGDVQVMPLTMALAKARVASGQVRALAVTTARRSAAMPDLPTVAESGYPGYEVTPWFAFLAPAHTPPDVVAKLNAELTRAMREPEVEKRLQNVGAELSPGSPQELQRVLETETARWAEVVQRAGIKID